MHKRTKALAIPQAVKQRVWERDNHCCVYCGTPYAFPDAHYIPRSQGGLGIDENILTLCRKCHNRYDQTTNRKEMKLFFRGYLESIYPDWNEADLIYKKGITP